jgi:MFS family permease
MARSLLAVVAGFLVILVPLNLANLLTFAIMVRTAQSDLPSWFQGLNAAAAFILSAVGGYVAAILSRRRPVVHASVVGAVILLLTVLTVSIGRPQWIPRPSSYGPVLLFALLRFGLTVAGGFLSALQTSRRAKRIASHA